MKLCKIIRAYQKSAGVNASVLLRARTSVVLGTALFLATFAPSYAQPQNKIGAGSGRLDVRISSEVDELVAAVPVHYYRASAHGPDDPIILVVPGGSRDGAAYRDAWIDAAERYDLLVVSPSFDSASYDGSAGYNVAGMIRNDFRWRVLDRATVVEASGDWLFQALDQIFDHAVSATGSNQETYDVFGHSAGAQIAHRLALFAPQTRANRIVAANAGWYTVPDDAIPFPYGLRNAPIQAGQLSVAFQRRLYVLLGDQDNENEVRGHLRDTKLANAQGSHRLSRGLHFFRTAERRSTNYSQVFAWEILVVPDVGHSYRQMSVAAGELLYTVAVDSTEPDEP